MARAPWKQPLKPASCEVGDVALHSNVCPRLHHDSGAQVVSLRWVPKSVHDWWEALDAEKWTAS